MVSSRSHPVPQGELASLLERTIEYKRAHRKDAGHENLRHRYKGNSVSEAVADATDEAQQAQQLAAPSTALFDSSTLRTHWASGVRSVGPGLENIANTCFMNSVSRFPRLPLSYPMLTSRILAVRRCCSAWFTAPWWQITCFPNITAASALSRASVRFANWRSWSPRFLTPPMDEKCCGLRQW